MTYLGGLDIGGTKCAVVLGRARENGVEILGKVQFPTPAGPHVTLSRMADELEALLQEHLPEGEKLASIGISCGGPLDSRRGLILSPPNLPGWDRVDCLTPLRERFGVAVAVQNDANACALAEWQWGAGRGLRHMVFLTFGTGMGAGLILNGELYAGASDMAGEVGHMRLEDTGPIGFGKAGSFEGFCSGGGIAQLARSRAAEALAQGQAPAFCPSWEALEAVTTKLVGEAAEQGDALALDIFETVGRKLGRGLAVLVDVLNPERIVIGSIYGRQQALLERFTMEELEREALSHALQACTVVPAGLGERIGDMASLSVALDVLRRAEQERI
ncbi:ROK family protein [Paenibacillus cremeus]|uniref:ROK family protein n=1 Tax=Paenibacillus cremeus TaxID=2163881 RepID=A0A559KDM1_9BACL|nr:ROK family protein [Paenibacillus cremeus]TVY10215.1 ROK family protein [Paenibacillus cremeus]